LINSKTYNELQTPLHFACKIGNLQAVKYLLSLFETNQEAKDYQHRTPLYLAAEHG
jgi:ankyrin repeat protein